MQALKFFSNHKQSFDKLVDISLVSLAKDGGSENGFCLSSAIVNFVLQKDGIQCARQMYKRYVVRPKASAFVKGFHQIHDEYVFINNRS